MFERYTEAARRVIFFARFEASHYGSHEIGSEHLLLGLFREAGPSLPALRGVGTVEAIRADVEAQITTGERFSTSVEVPLSPEGKNILNYASDSAEQLGQSRVEPIHLLIGILREEGCLASRILLARGLKASEIGETAAPLRKEQPRTPGVAPVIHVERTIFGILDAWRDRNAGKVAEFFDPEALLTDLRGDLWTGRDGIEQGLQKFFAKSPKAKVPGELTDLRSIRDEAWLATVTWTPSPRRKAKKQPSAARLVAVLNRNQDGWRIVWAHLINIAG